MLNRGIIACAAAVVCMAAGASEELVKNGGFEEYDSAESRFASFEFGKKTDKYRTLFFSRTEPGKNGKYALKAVGVKGHPYNRIGMAMEQNMGALRPGDRYVLSFQAKGEGTPAPEKFAAVELRQIKADGQSVCYNTMNIDLSAREWKSYSLAFPIQKDTASGVLRIVTRNLGSDDAFFIDDLSLKTMENK